MTVTVATQIVRSKYIGFDPKIMLLMLTDNQFAHKMLNEILLPAGLEKSSVLPVLDRFLKLKTDLFLDMKLKNRSINLFLQYTD